MEAKKHYTIFVSPSTMKRFMDEVGKKWGCTYGAKSLEIESALNNAIIELRNSNKEKAEARHTRTRYDIRADLIALRDNITSYLGDACTQVKEQDVLDTIKIVEGLTDNRPARNRLRLLETKGYCTATKSSSGIKLISFVKVGKSAATAEESIVEARAAQKKELELGSVLAKWELNSTKSEYSGQTGGRS